MGYAFIEDCASDRLRALPPQTSDRLRALPPQTSDRLRVLPPQTKKAPEGAYFSAQRRT